MLLELCIGVLFYPVRQQPNDDIADQEQPSFSSCWVFDLALSYRQQNGGSSVSEERHGGMPYRQMYGTNQWYLLVDVGREVNHRARRLLCRRVRETNETCATPLFSRGAVTRHELPCWLVRGTASFDVMNS